MDILAMTQGAPAIRNVSTRSSLERFYGSEGSVPDKFDRHEQCAVFPDGWAWAICTNWARYARRIEGPSCELYGFSWEENRASEIAREAGGHDFALLGGRYLIDGWVKGVAAMADRAVFDLLDPADAEAVGRLYGDRGAWKRLTQIEAGTDAETPEERAAAMKRVKLSRRGPPPEKAPRYRARKPRPGDPCRES